MSAMEQPLVSVIIPAWNAGEWIVETLSSVIAQTWKRIEIVVVDDGSTDSTASLIQQEFPTVRYFRQENAGQAAARNRGVAESSGSYLAFLDSDDLWLPEKIEAQMRLMLFEPEISLVFCDYDSFGSENGIPGFNRAQVLHSLPSKPIDEYGKQIIADDLLTPLLKDMFCQIPSCWLIRRSDFEKIDGFDGTLRNGGEDWLLAVHLANLGRFAFDQRRLAKRREHTSSHSRQNNVAVGLAQAMARLVIDKRLFPADFIATVNRRLAFSCLYIGQTSMKTERDPVQWFRSAMKYARSIPIREMIAIYLRAIVGIVKLRLDCKS